MDLKQAMKRIADLEERVRKLEARPEQHIHYHTHPAPMMPWLPAPLTPVPQYPAYDPFRWVPPPVITCGAVVNGVGTTGRLSN